MKQVVPKVIMKNKKTPKKKHKASVKTSAKSSRRNTEGQKYGTSNLEKDFAREFLDANGIVYIYQYELKDMGSRYMDFAVTCYRDKSYLMEEKDGVRCVRQDGQYFDVSFFIEVDGDYWHANPATFKGKELTPTQKHNLFVDRQKNEYAALHGIPLLRVWEHDIRYDKAKVLRELSKYVDTGIRKKRILDERKKPH